MIDLDDEKIVNNTANGKVVLTSIDAFPQQCQQAWEESSKIEFLQELKNVSNIVVCGMGGSRFAPYIVKELFKDGISVPYSINDNYSLPKYVGPSTLVILSSYSGTTHEVLECARLAKEKRAKITGLCLGDKLAQFFKTNNLPAYIFQAKYNPSQQPRIGVGYMLAGHIGLLFASGFLPIDKKTVDSAIRNLPALLSNFKMNIASNKNTAKKLALKLFEKYPYYVTAEHLQGVGNAIANQTNETAKSISSYRFIPELNHHLMEGLKYPKILKNMGVFVFFNSSLYDKRIQLRFNITKEVVEKNGLQTFEYQMKGKNKIEQVLELVGFGSYLTMYLSQLYGEDPAKIPWVDYFKKRLQELIK